MSSGGLRFWTLNYAESGTLLNGTGGGAPADDEVSPWIMENALTSDSSFLWQQSSGAGTFDLDIDLGADKTVGAFFFLGQRSAPAGGLGVTSVAVKTATAAGGYPAGLAAVTGSPFAMASGQRRAGLILANTITARYVRFEYTCSTAFTLGRAFVGGAVDYDFQQVSSPGRRRTRVLPRLRNEVGSNPTITRIGDDHFLYELDYDEILAAMFTKVQGVATLEAPAVMVETDDSVHEVVLSEDSFLDELMFDVPALTNAHLRLRTLG